MYIANIAIAIKRMSVNEIRDFIFENYYKRIEFSKENSDYSMEILKNKITCCLQTNEKKQCLIFLMLKNTTNHL